MRTERKERIFLLTAMMIMSIVLGPVFSALAVETPLVGYNQTGSNGSDIEIKWAPVTGATGYMVSVFYWNPNNRTYFPDNVLPIDVFTDCSYTTNVWYQGGVFGIVVQSYDQNRCLSLYSNIIFLRVTNNVVFYLNNDRTRVMLGVRLECLADENGNILKNIEGEDIYLHSMFLNHQDPCDDVIASGKVRNGWAKFSFPLTTYGDFFANCSCSDALRDRFWISARTPGDCKHPVTWWGCIPGPEVNAFYREDCQGQPGIEATISPTKIVPATGPCDNWGPGCY